MHYEEITPIGMVLPVFLKAGGGGGGGGGGGQKPVTQFTRIIISTLYIDIARLSLPFTSSNVPMVMYV